jgi:hypothetical protein
MTVPTVTGNCHLGKRESATCEGELMAILHKLMSGASRFPDEIGVFVTYQFVALTVASKSGWTRLGLSANENERSSSLHNGYSEGSVFLFGAPPLSRRLGFGSAS